MFLLLQVVLFLHNPQLALSQQHQGDEDEAEDEAEGLCQHHPHLLHLQHLLDEVEGEGEAEVPLLHLEP